MNCEESPTAMDPRQATRAEPICNVDDHGHIVDTMTPCTFSTAK